MKRWLLPILLAGMVPAGAVYVPPDDTGILFAKDALPMDADLMRELAGELAVLAQRPTGKDPARERTTAQLIALATRLDPTNRTVREINRTLSEGGEIEGARGKDLERAKKRAWEIADWLLTEDTGKDARRVGFQLADALRGIDASHPGAKRHQAGGESQRWDGVVAPLNHFRGRVAPPKPPEPPKPTIPEPKPTPPPEPEPEPTIPAPPIKIAEAALLTPFEVLIDGDRRVELVRLEMKIAPSEDHEDLDIKVIPAPPGEAALQGLLQARSRIRSALARQHGRLPEKQLATFESVGNLAYSSRNGSAFSGPATLMLASAIAGTELRDDLIFLGDVTADGRIEEPDFGWRYLEKLRAGKGGRLLVPSRFERRIRALLVFEEPDFFLRYEVIAVNTLEQALSMAAVDPGSPTLVEADAEFARFREVTAPASIGPLAVNKHVRERLTKILTANPGHLSAKMILLQGSSWRPTRLDRAEFWLEMERCLAPMEWLGGPRVQTTELQADELQAAHEICRRRLEPLTDRVDPEEQKQFSEARAVVDSLGALARLLKGTPNASEELVGPPYDGLRNRYHRLAREFRKTSAVSPSGSAPPASLASPVRPRRLPAIPE